jgi:hypothetical protein
MTALATFNFDGLGRVQISNDDYAFHAGVGRHHLAIRVGVTADWLPEGAAEHVPLALLTTTVRLTQPNHQHLADAAPVVVELRGHVTPHDVFIDLDDNQIIGIEQARDSGDVVLNLRLQLTVLNTPSLAYATGIVDAPARIPASRWIEMLDQSGAELAVVIRVSSPLTPGSPALADDTSASLARAAEWLRRGRDELRDGQYQNSIASCRLALENLERLVALPGEKKVRGIDPSQRTQDERWAAMYYDTRSLASAAHHDDDIPEKFVWTRTDAEAILATSAALVRRLSA